MAADYTNDVYHWRETAKDMREYGLDDLSAQGVAERIEEMVNVIEALQKENEALTSEAVKSK